MAEIIPDAQLAELLPLLPALVRAMNRRMAEVPPALKAIWTEHALAPRHMNVLLALSLYGPMSVTDLSARLGVGLATASLLVGELSRVGIVVRREDEDDRRRTIVELAPRHREAVAGYLSRRAGLLAQALAPLSPAERAGLLRGLRAIVDALGPDPEPG